VKRLSQKLFTSTHRQRELLKKLDEASRSLEKFAKNTTISVACRGNGIIEITVDAPDPKTALQLLKKVAKQVRVVYSGESWVV